MPLEDSRYASDAFLPKVQRHRDPERAYEYQRHLDKGIGERKQHHAKTPSQSESLVDAFSKFKLDDTVDHQPQKGGAGDGSTTSHLILQAPGANTGRLRNGDSAPPGFSTATASNGVRLGINNVQTLERSHATLDVPQAPALKENTPPQPTASFATNQQSSLTSSKHATASQTADPPTMPQKPAAMPHKPATMAQTPGVFMKGDPSLKMQQQRADHQIRGITQAARSTANSHRLSSAPTSVAEAAVNRKGRGFGGKNESPSTSSRASPARQPSTRQPPGRAASAGSSRADVSPPIGPSRGRGRGSVPTGFAAGPLRGDALIAEQNRRALQRHGGSTRTTMDPSARRRTPSPIARSIEKPTDIAANDDRFDNLNGPSAIRPEHIRLERNEPAAAPSAPRRSQSGQPMTIVGLIAGEKRDAVNPNEDQSHVKYFTEWAKPEQRTGGPAQKRRVVLSNLPQMCSPHDIANMIWGGEVEEIKFKEGDLEASVLFVNARRCARYHEDTANGIEYKNKAIFIELHNEVEPLVGIRKQLIDQGVTRCVRATNVADNLLPGPLNKLGKDTGAFDIMTMVFTGPRGKEVTWRFCNIEVASKFKASLTRDERFKTPNTAIYYVSDPCADADGVHD